MAILNRTTDGLLSVLLALRRALIAYGPQKESELRQFCAPESVAPKQGDMARKTLTRWKQLRVFQDVDGVIELAPSVVTIGPDDLPRLRSEMLRIVLSAENNPTLEQDGDNEGESSKATDFSRAAAWALAQDPYTFPNTWPACERLQDSQGITPKPLANDTRWQGFAEWAAFLGIGSPAGKLKLVPVPSFAVAWMLDDVFDGAAELTQEVFMDRLAEFLPVLDGGRYRQAVEQVTMRPWREPRENIVSPSLSAALLTLEKQGELRLEPRSDARQRILLGRGGRELHAFSHVMRTRAS